MPDILIESTDEKSLMEIVTFFFPLFNILKAKPFEEKKYTERKYAISSIFFLILEFENLAADATV